jgi:hypothetical protein
MFENSFLPKYASYFLSAEDLVWNLGHRSLGSSSGRLRMIFKNSPEVGNTSAFMFGFPMNWDWWRQC